MDRIVLQNLHSSEYEHPLDRTTLEALRKIPLAPKLIEIIDIPMNSVQRLQMLGSNVRASERQFPTVYRMMQEACEILDVEVPILYICSEPSINAFTSCPDKPIICIYSYLLDMLDDDETMFVIGHELAHIKSQHLVFKELGLLLSTNMLATIMSTVPGLAAFGQVAAIGLSLAYFEWSRMAEHTCDRGGYLACQNYRASCTALMKLAGYSKRYTNELNLEEFIKQGHEFTGIDSSALGVIQKVILSYGLSHPWNVSRVNELIRFNESGQYADILARKTQRSLGEHLGAEPSAAENNGVITGAAIKNMATGALSGLAKGILKFTEETKKDDPNG